jgi:kinesin family protein 4/21/27
LKPTDPGFDLIPQRFRESTCEVPNSTSLSVQSPQGRKLFVFDRVFDEQTDQEGVWEYISEAVASFTKGYNVSILAYGQSGAGKSYTMGTSGPEDQADSEVKGIVPRAAEALFEKLHGASSKPTGLQTPKRYSTQTLPTFANLNKMQGGPKTWELRASYVEIYNEHLRDLLIPEHIPASERGQVAIREDTKGRIMLTGLTQVPVNSAADLLNALNVGSTIRQTDATAINARSSRSHAVFSLHLIQKHAEGSSAISKSDSRRTDPINGGEGMVTLDSKLHFVDLAGSERLKNTGATGDRAKEGISINAGLASLGKVISQLSSKHGSGHVSYRDSKLTRLLQDSLGGNAITFMIACVTPAVFHLSETLNTVTYAQRARAIQSKPEIQQTHEDGDKQAAIERLRAEVSFLRDQIRHAEHASGKGGDRDDRMDRARGREHELQTQLLDMQENYNALSQRHAKLIAEISKSRDDENAETPLLNEAIGDNASERIKRSNSFAEAVEQVVLEYEKTIQSLESSLSKTRATLASTESTLMEKETRIAYMETIQNQLQSRIAKYVEREANNDSYTRDLEDKMEGASSEDDRKDTLIAELRKEIARVRENETAAEDYISTLEERLAEAEQDHEMMQREIDRLEHVVERQRSVGRLDNLLGELDEMRGDDPKLNGKSLANLPESTPKINGHDDPFQASVDDGFEKIERSDTMDNHHLSVSESQRSPAQDDFVAEKLENLTQEFFDLRSEHESVLNDYDNLHQKYRTALETLAKLEYEKTSILDTPKIPEAESPVTSSRSSFLVDAGMKDEDKAAIERPSSSRSSRSGLSSQPPQSTGAGAETEVNASPTESPVSVTKASFPPEQHEELVVEMETLKKLHAEKEVSVTELTRNYMSLAQRHEATLSQLEELKTEVQNAQRATSPGYPSSPGFNASPGLPHKGTWRRRSEEILGSNSDRASRSYVSLRTMVLNNFEEQADVRHSFEQNLSTVMAELHSRSERVQTLESELATIRKDMEQKQTIIAGLTRERSSLAAASASGVDFSIVGQMREQLVESENQIRHLHEQHAAREKELQTEVEALKKALADHQEEHQNLLAAKEQSFTLATPMEVPGDFPVTPALIEKSERQTMDDTSHNDEVQRLQDEVTAWENTHREAIDSMSQSQQKLLSTISELQESLRQAQANGSDRAADNANMDEILGQEQAKHMEFVNSLTNQVQEHKLIADERASRLERLQKEYSELQEKTDSEAKSVEMAQREASQYKELVSNLENQLEVHKSAVALHQESLESLQASHSKEMDDHATRYAELQQQHEQMTTDLEQQLQQAKGEVATLLRSASQALGYETDPTQLHNQIRGLVEEGKEIHNRHLKTTNELRTVQEELQNTINRSAEMEIQMDELKALCEERTTKLDDMTDKYKKSSALVEQLEEQLNNNYDEHQTTNKRLSSMQSETAQARAELVKELEDAKSRTVSLEVRDYLSSMKTSTDHPQQQLNALKHLSLQSNSSSHYNRESLSPDAAAHALGRTGSSSSNPRKSGPTALPTPPPSIPLPPLPGSPNSSGFPQPGGRDRATSPTPRGPSPSGHSPPTSRHTSNEVIPSPAVTQLIEEQEARIRTIEKHLFAEKQLTATLEEALVDLETSANRTKSEMENWRKKCQSLEDELVSLRKERSNSRASLQAVEEEREMRVRAERARQALEQRMAELNANKKKKKGGLNCF